MNGRKAKALRKKTGFDPNSPRSYEALPVGKGRKQIVCSGFRKSYQKAKKEAKQ